MLNKFNSEKYYKFNQFIQGAIYNQCRHGHGRGGDLFSKMIYKGWGDVQISSTWFMDDLNENWSCFFKDSVRSKSFTGEFLKLPNKWIGAFQNY